MIYACILKDRNKQIGDIADFLAADGELLVASDSERAAKDYLELLFDECIWSPDQGRSDVDVLVVSYEDVDYLSAPAMARGERYRITAQEVLVTCSCSRVCGGWVDSDARHRECEHVWKLGEVWVAGQCPACHIVELEAKGVQP